MARYCGNCGEPIELHTRMFKTVTPMRGVSYGSRLCPVAPVQEGSCIQRPIRLLPEDAKPRARKTTWRELRNKLLKRKEKEK